MRSVQPTGNSLTRRDCSVRPGAPPSTLMRTTGRSWLRNASASRAAWLTTSAIGCAVARSTMPFCKSTTSRAGLASSALIVMLLLLHCWESLAGLHSRARPVCSGVDQAIEKAHRSRKLLLFLWRQLGLDGAKQPIVPRRAAAPDQFATGRRERKYRLPPVLRIRRSADHPGGLEHGNGGAHRLRADALGAGKCCDRRRALRSRCISTEVCEGVRSPAEASARRRRLSLPLSACSSAARAEARVASNSSFRLPMASCSRYEGKLQR